MIIHLDGTVEELLKFVNGMQFRSMADAELEDDPAETEREVAGEIEKSFGAKEMPLGDPAEEEDHWYKVSIEPSVAMMMHLAAKAARAEKTIPEVIIDMIEIDMHRKGKGK